MTQLFHIDTEPALTSADVLRALDRQGIVGTLTATRRAPASDEAARLTLRVERAIADLGARIQRALEDAIDRRDLPLLTEQIGHDRFVVRPPAG
jgi:hypothetical protein